jgi:hypothetical protein
MSFSAFSRFGLTGFSGAPQIARVIFETALSNLGPGYDSTLDGNHRIACIYADSMGLADAIATLRRTRNNAVGLKCTDLLPAMESLFGLKPRPGATLRRRRQRLHARMLVAQGGKEEVVSEILTTIFGTGFISWTSATAGTLVRFPDTAAEAAAIGNFVKPGQRARILKTTTPVFAGLTQTVSVTELSTPPDLPQALNGVPICIDPGMIPRHESTSITSHTTGTGNKVTAITATFANDHDIGSIMTTQYMPLWRSNAQHHRIRLTSAAATDADKRAEAGEELRRVMKSTARWDLTEAGPFLIGEGLIGITEL